ncbi:MAG: hypothetical protein K2H96_03450 [Muribaculaceae bacterium]|nr:hypothetical protein [Muribaculaceae bacterium]
MNRFLSLSGFLLGSSLFSPSVYSVGMTTPDSIPSGFRSKPEWIVGAEMEGDYVIPTDAFFKGANVEERRISGSLGGAVRGAFRFNPASREGMLYPGLYQGVGLGIKTFFRKKLMGNPGMFYALQGAPFHHFSSRLSLGYEWKFGIAFGWHHTDNEIMETASTISTAVTAHMGVALKLNYALSERWMLSLGIEGTHHSNGNTSWRNGGLNAAGVSIGASYIINPLGSPLPAPKELKEEADHKRWFFDLMAFGAWRKRVIYLPDCEYTSTWERFDAMAPGKYPVFGVQFAPSITLNRWVAIGPALDVQWDKSADLSRHWIAQPVEEGFHFTHVPFEKQISVGISAHAELTTPIFAINGGIGFNIVNPKGDRAFYQSLTIKTFVTEHIYLNVGYRLGEFKDPHNLMLGIGYRFK